MILRDAVPAFPILSSIVDHLIYVACAGVAALVASLLVSAKRWIEAHTKLKLSPDAIAALQGWAGKAIAYAAEQAVKWEKSPGAGKMPGSAKLEHACGYLLDMAQLAGWNEDQIAALAKDKLAKVIEAHLSGTRPAPAPAPLAAALVKILLPLFLLLGLARPARADFATGPTIPVVRVDLGAHAGTSVLGAGAGYQLSYGFLPVTLAGRTWDRLSVELAGFFGHDAGVTSGSLAALVCTMQGLVCAGAGYDLYRSSGTRAAFVLLSLGFNFGLASSPMPAPPSSGPLVGIGMAPPPTPPGNTVEF
jgi:hypothetical protein